MSGILGIALIGFLAGALAKLIMPGKDPGGCIITMLLGVAGAFIGAYISNFLGLGPQTGAMGFASAVGGSVILLVLYRLLGGGKKK